MSHCIYSIKCCDLLKALLPKNVPHKTFFHMYISFLSPHLPLFCSLPEDVLQKVKHQNIMPYTISSWYNHQTKRSSKLTFLSNSRKNAQTQHNAIMNDNYMSICMMLRMFCCVTLFFFISPQFMWQIEITVWFFVELKFVFLFIITIITRKEFVQNLTCQSK